MDIETRLRQSEALTLLTNRLLMDYISLQIDSGRWSVEEAKALVRFSSQEVICGSSQLAPEVEFFRDILTQRIDQTQYSTGMDKG